MTMTANKRQLEKKYHKLSEERASIRTDITYKRRDLEVLMTMLEDKQAAISYVLRHLEKIEEEKGK